MKILKDNINILNNVMKKCKDDVKIKLKLLDENRVQVMKQQLLLFHNAIGAYFSVTRQQLNL